MKLSECKSNITLCDIYLDRVKSYKFPENKVNSIFHVSAFAWHYVGRLIKLFIFLQDIMINVFMFMFYKKFSRNHNCRRIFLLTKGSNVAGYSPKHSLKFFFKRQLKTANLELFRIFPTLGSNVRKGSEETSENYY